jgi:hypothetical protein
VRRDEIKTEYEKQHGRPDKIVTAPPKIKRSFAQFGVAAAMPKRKGI